MNQSIPNSAVPSAITRKLHLVRQRKMWVHFASALVAGAAVLLVAMAIAMLIDWLATLYDARWRAGLTTTALAAAVLTVGLWLFAAWRRGLRWERLAGDVDRQLPQLEQRWTTMTRLGSDASNPAVVHPAMLRRVATEAACWDPHVMPDQIVSLTPLSRALIGLTAITAVLAVAVLLDSHRTIVLLRRFWLPGSSISATQLVNLPGNLTVGKGETVSLVAAVQGSPVQQATLFMQSGADQAQAISLVASGEEPIGFAYRVRSVESPFAYRFRAGDGQTEWFRVDVAERPEIGELKLTITPPAYTGRSTTSFTKLPRRVSALEKSELEVAIRPTVPLQSLQLRMDDSRTVDLSASEDGWYRWKTTLKDGFTLSPILTESHGLTNLRPPKCQINVFPDKPPIVKITSPDDQMAVRPDDTVEIIFAAQDDVGIGSAVLELFDGSDPDAGQIPIATIPIPLDEQMGARNVQGAVNLDLKQFAVADGSRLIYEIRVTESRDGDINAAASRRPPRQASDRNRTNDRPTTANSATAPGERTSPTNSDAASRPAVASNQATQPSATSSSQQSNESSAVASTNPAATNPSVPGKTPSTATNSANSATSSDRVAASPSNQSTAPTTNPNSPAATGEMPNQSSKPGENSIANSSPTNPNNANDASGNSPDAPRTTSSGRQSLNPGDMANAKGNGTPNPNSNTSNDSPSASGNRNQSGMANSSPSPSSSGSSSPPDQMPRRSLDVAQSSTSSRMRLEVDQWAGSFTGQQRSKLEMAISPELEALDAALARAQEAARTVLDEMDARGEWRGKHDRDVTNAERATVDAQNVIGSLQKRTNNTPYAFIGLQLTDIGAAHVNPARSDFWTGLQADGEARIAAVRDGWQHVTRARELVAALTGQFRRAQREFELADSVQQVKKMYQIFIEDSLALLGEHSGDPNRYPRKIAELELDEEYLKRLREVMEMRRDMQAELARILSEDPRLLRRFMDILRNSATNLREALAELVADQQDLNREVLAWTLDDDADRPRLAKILLLRHVHDAAELSQAAGELQDRYKTWMPLARDEQDEDVAAATQLMQQTATAATELGAKASAFASGMQRITVVSAAPAAGAATNGDAAGTVKVWDSEKAYAEMLGEAEGLYKNLTELEVAFRQMGTREDDAEIAVFAANRLVEVRRLITNSTAWIRQLREQKAGNYGRAAEVEQYRLVQETDRLAARLADIEQTLVGLMQRPDRKLPEPIAARARTFLSAMDQKASPNQLAAVYALRESQLPRAVERQKAAHEGLTEAEKAFDEMMRLAVAEMDKLPVQDPIAQLLEDPTLDELLAALEQEIPLAELLGINARPSNVQFIGDWMRPGGGGSGGGGGAGQGFLGNQIRARAQRARQRLDRTYDRAVARALKESDERPAVVIPAGAMQVAWNRLVSELGDDLQQGRGKAAPEQYRRAIEQYFAEISRLVSEKQGDQP